MISRPESLEKLLAILRSLPSVGPKMSERIAFYLLRLPEEEIKNFIEVIQESCQKIKPCSICGYWDDVSPCRICSDSSRDNSVLCVVENSQDLIAMSRVRNYNGLYHVLGGALSPLEGIGPQDLHIETLLKRLESGTIREVVLGLNADIEGETTAQFLAKQIYALRQKSGDNGNGHAMIKITRLAQGLPVGGELEYMDEMTLMRAFDGRKDI